MLRRTSFGGEEAFRLRGGVGGRGFFWFFVILLPPRLRLFFSLWRAAAFEGGEGEGVGVGGGRGKVPGGDWRGEPGGEEEACSKTGAGAVGGAVSKTGDAHFGSAWGLIKLGRSRSGGEVQIVLEKTRSPLATPYALHRP